MSTRIEPIVKVINITRRTPRAERVTTEGLCIALVRKGEWRFWDERCERPAKVLVLDGQHYDHFAEVKRSTVEAFPLCGVHRRPSFLRVECRLVKLVPIEEPKE